MSAPVTPLPQPALAAARARSLEMLAALRARLVDALAGNTAVDTIAASGSLARLELTPESDADLIVVLHDNVSPDSAAAADAMAVVMDAASGLGMASSKPTGVYAAPVTRAALIDPATRGLIADDVAVFGKRMQLLIESRPIYRDDSYGALVAAVVDRYASGFVTRDEGKQWTYLINDLARYFRSYCVSKQWDFAPSAPGNGAAPGSGGPPGNGGPSGGGGGGWLLRDIKLRHSRLVGYAGLLCLLGESGKHAGDKVAWLKDHLHLTPVERLGLIYQCNRDPGFTRVLACYDRYIAALTDSDVRAALGAAAPASPDDLAAVRCPVYDELKENGRTLRTELARFMLDRRGDWGDRFIELLVL